jgi:hypothetical protein
VEAEKDPAMSFISLSRICCVLVPLLSGITVRLAIGLAGGSWTCPAVLAVPLCLPSDALRFGRGIDDPVCDFHGLRE